MIPPTADGAACGCALERHEPHVVAVTGGPGAGKTALLEVVRRHFCRHVGVLPESAGIVFGGGFPRERTMVGRRAAQIAIFHVQRQLERWAIESGRHAAILCDRGTLDGLAYWPDAAPTYFAEIGSTHAEELARYAAVIHLRTPSEGEGYDRSNPLRTESAHEAARIDARIAEVWRDHPRVVTIESHSSFLEKIERALEAIYREVPSCCRPPTLTLGVAAPSRAAAPVDT